MPCKATLLACLLLICLAARGGAQERPAAAFRAPTAVDHGLFVTPALQPALSWPILPPIQRPNRTRRVVIGAALGAVFGLTVCPIMAAPLFEEITGGEVTTCTARGNLILGGGGLVLGAILGWAL
jgi:hypothetical protein